MTLGMNGRARKVIIDFGLGDIGATLVDDRPRR